MFGGCKLALKDLKNKLPFIKKEEDLESSFDIGNQQLQDLLSPDSIVETDTHMRLGGNYAKTLVAVQYKPILDREKIMSLNEISENVSICFYVQEIDQHDIRKQLSQSIKQNNTKLNGKYVSHAAQAEILSQINSAEMQLHQLTYSNDKVFMFQMVIHIVGSSINELDALTKQVKTRLGQFAKTLAPTEKMRDAFDSFLPLHKNKVYDLTYRPMDTEAVSYFFPFHQNEYFQEKGLIKGKNSATGNIISVDDDLILNKHQIVIGMTGVGKSTYLATDILRKYMIGRRIIIIDPKNDYTDLVKDCGGEVVKFTFRGGNVINPFDVPPQIDNKEEENNLYDNISTLLTVFRLIHPQITELQEDVLQKILLKLYENKGIDTFTNINELRAKDFPIMEDLYLLINDMQEKGDSDYETLQHFHSVLYAYTYGMFGKILNGHTNVNTNNDMVSYDINSLINDQKAQRVIYYLLLSHVKQKVLNGDRQPTQFYIDECHLLADPKVPLAMNDLYVMMKLFRSFNCGITPATQSIKDFLSAKDESRNYGEAVIINAVQRLYLPMSEEEITFLESELNNTFSQKEKQKLQIEDGDKKKHAGKGIYMVGGTKIEIDVTLTNMEHRLWFRDSESSKVVDIGRSGSYA